ncbi:hypothetical protein E1288_05395 [Saccharopolyspora elongata]|uniref:Uncharacterized protein n=1 Tax=Saccharopolyspora elongata TaxID=2530387 RepID=A0A4R4ZA75_9PSEU|nr:hypothetical protein E1288_05395 [Saccharopolyspora elongata]
MLAACAAVIVSAGCGEPTSLAGSPAVSAPMTSAPGAEVTVRGTVQRGIEPNSLVLSTADQEYLLVHPTPALQPGVMAVVRGRPARTEHVTMCMQGTPLVVLDASVR